MLDRLGGQSCLYACQALSRICRVEDGPIASLSHVSSGRGCSFQPMITNDQGHMQGV